MIQGCYSLELSLKNMVVISNVYLNVSEEEHTIVSHNFKDIMASTKHFILFPNNNICSNSLKQERNLNNYK